MKEQIKGFNEAYKIIKKKKFENYFCLFNTTWKEAKKRFDQGMNLQGKILINEITKNVNVILTNSKGESIPLCKTCKRIMNPQEFKAGFEECEHCAGHCGCHSVLKPIEAQQ